jgi:DNA-binding XRE family transcriptional regulator
MIANKRQYGITKNWVKKFQEALLELEQRKSELHPIAFKAQRASLVSQLETFDEEIKTFEALQKSDESISPSELEVLPERLVRARVAAGLTQKDLAERVGVKEQQIQRYETTKYASASLSRLVEVARAIRGIRGMK